jgi:GNAT superfamily N-acetyltransferase
MLMAEGQPFLHFEPVVEADFETLAALREAALRESLERLGLFSQERSRERLRSNFRPAFMRHIVWGDKRVGLLTLWPEGDALKLQHLYLSPGAQGKGIGAWVLEQVKAEARAQGRDVKLEALPQSDANRFYQRHGFVQVGAAEFDVFYVWPVEQRAVV